MGCEKVIPKQANVCIDGTVNLFLKKKLEDIKWEMSRDGCKFEIIPDETSQCLCIVGSDVENGDLFRGSGITKCDCDFSRTFEICVDFLAINDSPSNSCSGSGSSGFSKFIATFLNNQKCGFSVSCAWEYSKDGVIWNLINSTDQEFNIIFNEDQRYCILELKNSGEVETPLQFRAIFTSKCGTVVSEPGTLLREFGLANFNFAVNDSDFTPTGDWMYTGSQWEISNGSGTLISQDITVIETVPDLSLLDTQITNLTPSLTGDGIGTVFAKINDGPEQPIIVLEGGDESITSLGPVFPGDKIKLCLRFEGTGTWALDGINIFC